MCAICRSRDGHLPAVGQAPLPLRALRAELHGAAPELPSRSRSPAASEPTYSSGPTAGRRTPRWRATSRPPATRSGGPSCRATTSSPGREELPPRRISLDELAHRRGPGTRDRGLRSRPPPPADLVDGRDRRTMPATCARCRSSGWRSRWWRSTLRGLPPGGAGGAPRHPDRGRSVPPLARRRPGARHGAQGAPAGREAAQDERPPLATGEFPPAHLPPAPPAAEGQGAARRARAADALRALRRGAP